MSNDIKLPIFIFLAILMTIVVERYNKSAVTKTETDLTAVLNWDNGTIVKLKAEPEISNSNFYDLVSKETGIPRSKLNIVYPIGKPELTDSHQYRLSARQLVTYKTHFPGQAERKLPYVFIASSHPITNKDRNKEIAMLDSWA